LEARITFAWDFIQDSSSPERQTRRFASGRKSFLRDLAISRRCRLESTKDAAAIKRNSPMNSLPANFSNSARSSRVYSGIQSFQRPASAERSALENNRSRFQVGGPFARLVQRSRNRSSVLLNSAGNAAIVA
jgi:hypothetical protein